MIFGSLTVNIFFEKDNFVIKHNFHNIRNKFRALLECVSLLLYILFFVNAILCKALLECVSLYNLNKLFLSN